MKRNGFMNYNNFVLELKRLKLTVFSLNDAQRIINKKRAYTSVYLSRFIKSKRLVLIKKGIYALPSSLFEEIATSIVESSYITMLSALYHYSIIDQQPNNTIVFNSSISRKLDIRIPDGAYRIKLVKITPKRLFGFERIDTQNGYIYIATPEKAIVDALYLPKLCAQSYIEDALLDSDKIDIKKLINFANAMESHVVLIRLQLLFNKLNITGYDKFIKVKRIIPKKFNLSKITTKKETKLNYIFGDSDIR